MKAKAEFTLPREAAITIRAQVTAFHPAPGQPRALGDAAIAVRARSGRAELAALRQSGSMKVLFPRRDGAAMQAVLINTAGGITGGDRFRVAATAHQGAELTLSTQAAERAYRALPGETGQLRTRLSIGENARINWLPQETILFHGCALERTLSVDMAASSRLLLAEPLVFGRAAMRESLTNAALFDRIDIRRDGGRIFLDAVRLDGDVAAQLARPATAGGAGAMAIAIYIAPDAEAHLGPVRQMLPDTAGASLIGDDLLVIRILAADSFLLRNALIPILNRLTQDQLPRCWMI